MKRKHLLYALLLSLVFVGCSQQPDVAMEEDEAPQQSRQTADKCTCNDNSIILQENSRNECCDRLTNKIILKEGKDLRINVVGQGVAPVNTTSPAQAYALAKRAAITDGYRLLAEKVKGVDVEGQDVIKNMMVKRSNVRTYVDATIRNANVIETTFKDGLCEVEMEVVLSYAHFLR